ncbi:MAG TPA: nitroreductase family deazaflavin-dependent oxidoreductase, partial [Acidimicrobiia bacterium]|nr:nitroreductase family deazaflavin-dependent oxidoreductase [Acidimicrobiia bacterium]
VPLVYLEVDDGFVVMAANGGRGPIPEWYRNLLAAGTGVADLGRRRLRVTPRVLDGDEREAMAATLAHVAPSTPHYSTLAGRELPLVLLALDGPA